LVVDDAVLDVGGLDGGVGDVGAQDLGRGEGREEKKDCKEDRFAHEKGSWWFDCRWRVKVAVMRRVFTDDTNVGWGWWSEG
jgi:hypothetical protein